MFTNKQTHKQTLVKAEVTADTLSFALIVYSCLESLGAVLKVSFINQAPLYGKMQDPFITAKYNDSLTGLVPLPTTGLGHSSWTISGDSDFVSVEDDFSAYFNVIL